MDSQYKGQVSFAKATAEELERMVWKGRMVQDLRVGAFFKDCVAPAMKAEIDSIREGLDWNPGGKTDIESIALDRVWRSGLIHGAKTFTRVLNTMLYEAEQAQKELDKRAEAKSE